MRLGLGIIGLGSVTLALALAPTSHAHAQEAKAPSSVPQVQPVSGPKVRVETLKAGQGTFPRADGVVLINYKGMLANGTVFDEAQGMPMLLGEVIPGFAQGLTQMQRGGRYKLTIPPELGYGAQDNGPIPANSTLIFEIELIDFKTQEEMAAIMAQFYAQMEAQQAAPVAPASPVPAPSR